MAITRFLNDKYKTTLIRINPLKERRDHYNWEKEQYLKISSEHQFKQDRKRMLEKTKREYEYH